MQFVIELYKLACCTVECKVACRGWKGKRGSQLGLPSNPKLGIQGIGGRAVRILRNAYCPRTVLCVYAQYLSASRSGLAAGAPELRSWERWKAKGSCSRREWSNQTPKKESVDVLSLRSRVAPPPCG
jgi:hypothetical protein